MFKFFFHNFYLFFYDLLNLVKNFGKKRNFIIILPRCISILIKKIIIFDKKKKIFFIQSIRDNYDLLTVYEVFFDEHYNLKNLKNWNIVNSYYDKIKKTNKKPLIVDCGSNIGSSSNYFSRIFFGAFVVSIEPEINNFLMMKKNFCSSNSVLINKAISCDNLNYSLNISADPRGHFINISDLQDKNIKINSLFKEGGNVETITVNEILNNYKNDCIPFLIKIDIEGFEQNLFYKNFEWMKDFLIIIIEIHDWMIPNKSISSNFIKALNEVNKDEKNKRDIIISGENLICIRRM
jgi:FkbM family methyltransferase